MFRGTPQDYARMLASAYDGIKARSPASRVLLGGVSGTIAKDWLTRSVRHPGSGAPPPSSTSRTCTCAAELGSLTTIYDSSGTTSTPRISAGARPCG